MSRSKKPNSFIARKHLEGKEKASSFTETKQQQPQQLLLIPIPRSTPQGIENNSFKQSLLLTPTTETKSENFLSPSCLDTPTKHDGTFQFPSALTSSRKCKSILILYSWLVLLHTDSVMRAPWMIMEILYISSNLKKSIGQPKELRCFFFVY